MKVQLKNLRSLDIKILFNSVSKIVTKLEDIKSLSSMEVSYDISDFLSNNEILQGDYHQYLIYYSDKHRIVLHLYDVSEHPENCEIIMKEDNKLFEDQIGVDFIFVPKQLITGDSPIENVFTALFVIFHLALRFIAGDIEVNQIEDENYSLLASLLAALLVSEDVFYIDNNLFYEYKDITKETVNKLLNSKAVIQSSYIYFNDEICLNNYSCSNVFNEIIIEYLHEVHNINGERDYYERQQ